MKKPKLIFCDFDGTLTSDRVLPTTFWDILQWCQTNEVPLVIATGRAVTWGHFLLTHFPMNKIITEGGGVILRRTEQGIQMEVLADDEDVAFLKNYTEKFKTSFPWCPLSFDSHWRITDRAINYQRLTEEQLKQVTSSFESEKMIQYYFSDVHLNFWCGEISKFLAVERMLKQDFPALSLDDLIYFGDAPNDQSCFENIPHSVGVSNLKQGLEHPPSIILSGQENIGPWGVLNYLKNNFS